ncbi:hypothetical protein EMIT0111MI5_290033 [Burkholderia sp. IT-111MI5]
MDLPDGVVAGRRLRLNTVDLSFTAASGRPFFCHLAYDADCRHNEDADERTSNRNAAIEAATRACC